MNIYSYSEVKQNLSAFLQKAKTEGKIFVQNKDGVIFEIKVFEEEKSPLDIEGINTSITKDEILDSIKDSRKKYY